MTPPEPKAPEAVAEPVGPVGANLLHGAQPAGVVEQQDERVAVGMVRAPGVRELFDAATGQPPDPDDLFARVGHSGTLFECRVRLMERVWLDTATAMERLVLPAGRQVSAAGAAQIVGKVRSQPGSGGQ